MLVQTRTDKPLELRPPSWADRDSIVLTHNGQPVPIAWTGPDAAYVKCPHTRRGDSLHLNWDVPCFVQQQPMLSVPGREFDLTVQWEGNEVEAVDPPGKYLRCSARASGAQALLPALQAGRSACPTCTKGSQPMSLRLVNFVPRTWPDSAPRAGALLDDAIIDIAEACEAADVECGCAGSVVDLLSCADCLQLAREAVAQAEPSLPLSRPPAGPVIRPGKLFCLAGNYEEHIREGAGKDPNAVHESDKTTPRIFMKPVPNTVCGPDDPILIGRAAKWVDYEGELAVIIGKRGKYIPATEALDYVGGVTCCNDISERRLKIWERAETRERDRFFDWLNGKWCDNSARWAPARCRWPTPATSRTSSSRRA